MFVLSEGVQRTGVIHMLGRPVAASTGDSESRQLERRGFRTDHILVALGIAVLWPL